MRKRKPKLDELTISWLCLAETLALRHSLRTDASLRVAHSFGASSGEAGINYLALSREQQHERIMTLLFGPVQS